MPDIVMMIVILGLTVVNLVLLVILHSRVGKPDKIETALAGLERLLERQERFWADELARNRQDSLAAAQSIREELTSGIQRLGGNIVDQMASIGAMQKSQLDTFANQLVQLTQINEQKLTSMREALDKNLKEIRDENSQKLEQMRATVDEKLNATLEQRLGESFRLVSERLELVHKGLGEMQSLASGVGDLKRVLTNIKTRGTWGEMQLGNLLEQVLTPEQYGRNVATKKGSNERVEFAIRLPGRDSEGPVWLPVDAKFPQEDYQRLLDAQEKADPAAVEEAASALEKRIRDEARDIYEKYIDPPHTTDFAIMFLPVEGLFAEVLRRPGLLESMQQKYRVTVTGPTTFTALLTSLQMGFRTLAIEKRSSEVWTLLGAVKTEFGKFGEMLEKTRKKLQEATNTMDTAAQRTRQIERRLKAVEALPPDHARQLLGPEVIGPGDGDHEEPIEDRPLD